MYFYVLVYSSNLICINNYSCFLETIREKEAVFFRLSFLKTDMKSCTNYQAHCNSTLFPSFSRRSVSPTSAAT